MGRRVPLHLYLRVVKVETRYGAREPLDTQSSRRDWLQWARRLRRDGRCLLDWEDEWHLVPLNASMFSVK